MLGILAKALVVNHLVAALYNRVKTAASSGVAGWPRLVDLYQNAVAVTVKADLHNLLNMTACRSFDPKFLSGPAPIRDIPRVDRTLHAFSVHPSQHQYFVSCRILRDCRDQPCLIVGQCGGVKLHWGPQKLLHLCLRALCRQQSTKETMMSGDTDLIKLYSARILALAADIPHLGRLEAPDASVKRRAPLCGSTVTVDVTVTDGVLDTMAQDVKACALGQAAAAVTGAAATGASLAQIETARDELRAMLKEQGPVPKAPFDGFEVLQPAAAYKNRHASILLSIEALAEAMHSASDQVKVGDL